MSVEAKLIIIYLVGWIAGCVAWGVAISRINMTSSAYFNRYGFEIIMSIVFWPALVFIGSFIGAILVPMTVTRWVVDWLAGKIGGSR